MSALHCARDTCLATHVETRPVPALRRVRTQLRPRGIDAYTADAGHPGFPQRGGQNAGERG